MMGPMDWLSTEKITIFKSHKSIYLMVKCTWSSFCSSLVENRTHSQNSRYLVMAYVYFVYQHAWYIDHLILNQYWHFSIILRQPDSLSSSPHFLTLNRKFPFQLKKNSYSRNVALNLNSLYLNLGSFPSNQFVSLPTKKIVWNYQMLMIKLCLAYLHWCF